VIPPYVTGYTPSAAPIFQKPFYPTFDGDRRPRDNGGMDAISPEYRLEPTGPGSFTWGEWQIDDDHALMMHEPTRAVFSIYLADGTAPAAPSVYQLRKFSRIRATSTLRWLLRWTPKMKQLAKVEPCP
jgi:hypothetical protein